MRKKRKTGQRNNKPMRRNLSTSTTPPKKSIGAILISSAFNYLNKITPHLSKPLNWIWTLAIATIGLVTNWEQASTILPQQPKIEVQPVQISTPFHIHFSAYNSSLFFTAHDVSFSCLLKDVRGPISFENTRITDETFQPRNIPPGKSINFKCQLYKFIKLNENSFTSAHMQAIIYYKDPWKGGISETTEDFTWDANTMQWIRGEVLN